MIHFIDVQDRLSFRQKNSACTSNRNEKSFICTPSKRSPNFVKIPGYSTVVDTTHRAHVELVRLLVLSFVLT